MDWKAMNRLHKKGWIPNPKSKAESVPPRIRNALPMPLQVDSTVSYYRDQDLPRPQKATASVPTFCGRDVVPLSPAVREANRRNHAVPRACPWGSTPGVMRNSLLFRHLMLSAPIMPDRKALKKESITGWVRRTGVSALPNKPAYDISHNLFLAVQLEKEEHL